MFVLYSSLLVVRLLSGDHIYINLNGRMIHLGVYRLLANHKHITIIIIVVIIISSHIIDICTDAHTNISSFGIKEKCGNQWWQQTNSLNSARPDWSHPIARFSFIVLTAQWCEPSGFSHQSNSWQNHASDSEPREWERWRANTFNKYIIYRMILISLSISVDGQRRNWAKTSEIPIVHDEENEKKTAWCGALLAIHTLNAALPHTDT